MGLEEAQVAEVFVPASGGFGSGYLVSPRLVLTARHVVEAVLRNREPPKRPAGPLTARLISNLATGLQPCRVRLLSRTAGRPFHDAVPIWWRDDVDAALLAVLDHTDPSWEASPSLTGLTWADVSGADPVDCLAVGFPVADADGDIRESRELDGTIMPLSHYKKGRLVIQARGTISQSPTGEMSAWAGMSGAAVFAEGLLIGVLRFDADPLNPTRMELWAESARVFGADHDFAGWLRADGGRGAWTRSPSGPQQRIRLRGIAQANNYRGGADKPGVFSLSPPVTSLPDQVRGRDEILSELDGLLTTSGGSGRPQVIAGLGGAGKTTVALRLAAQARSRGAPVWWISARDEVTLSAGMRELALTLGAEPRLVQAAWEGKISATDLLWRRLEKQATRWLLIIDEADDPEVLLGPSGFPYDDSGWLRPTDNGLIVITTRDASPEIWRHADIHDMPTLKPGPGGQVIVDAISPALPAGYEQHAGLVAEVALLCERLGGLPLALNLAGTYLRQKIRQDFRQGIADDITGALAAIVAYRRALDQSLSILDSAAALGGRRSEESISRLRISRTWELSLDLLDRRGYSDARPLIQVLSCYAPDPLPLDLLDSEILAGSSIFGDTFNEFRRNELLQALDDLSLVRQRAQVVEGRPNARPIPCVSAHRLVLDTVAANLSNDQDLWQEIWAIAIELTAVGSERDFLDFRNWAWWELLAPHVQSILDGCPLVEELVEATVSAAFSTLSFIGVSGKLQSAIAMARSIQMKAENVLPADHYLLVITRLKAGEMLLLSGQFVDAKNECERFLSELRDSPELDDEDKNFIQALILTLLGSALLGLYRLADAEDAFRLAINSTSDYQAVDQTRIASARLGLAETLSLQERLAESEAELRAMVDANEGAEDTVINLLARLGLARIRCRRNVAGAETELRALLDAQRPTLGDDHPAILTASCEAAVLRARRGNLRIADAEIRAVLEALRRVLGEDHPQTLATRYELAVVLRQRGQLEAAEAEFRAVLSAKSETLGPGDPGTLATRHELAVVLRQRGQLEAAEAEFRAVLSAKSETLGPGDRSTLVTRHELAVTLRQRGQLEAVEAEFRAVLSAKSETLGPGDPGTLATRHELAVTLRQRGQPEAAEAEFRAVLSAKSETLGPGDPGTLATRHELAVTLRQRGQPEAAEAEFRAVLSAKSETLGPGDPGTLATRHELAVTLRQRGQLEAAEAEFRAVLSAKSETLGPGDPGTLATRHELAVTLRQRGQLEAAEAEFRAVLSAKSETLGPGDPGTLATRHELAVTLRQRGQLEAAEAEFRAVLAAERQALGEHDRDVLGTRYELAVTLRQRGQLEAAEAEFRAVLSAKSETLGPGDPSTLATRCELAVTLRQRGELAAAQETHNRDHQDMPQANSFTNWHNLAHSLRRRHELRESATEFRTVFDGERILDLGQRGQLIVTQNFADVLAELGEFSAAESAYRALLHNGAKVLGEYHEIVLASRLSIVQMLRAQNDIEKATAECERLLNLQIDTLGATENHPTVLPTRHEMIRLAIAGGRLGQVEAELSQLVDASYLGLGRDHRLTLDAQNDLVLLQNRSDDTTSSVERLQALFTAKTQISVAEYINATYKRLCSP